MIEPGRKYSAGSGYRYGFNGKENDNEVKGIEGSQQDYGMRIYDPRVARFLSTDPLTDEFAWWTPYQFAGNTPTNTIDLDGMEVPKNKNKNKTEKAVKKSEAVDFSGAKLKRENYKSWQELAQGDPFANISTFGMNTAKAGWNQLVDLAEIGVNLTSADGMNKIWNETILPTAKFIFFDWQNLNPEQQLNFLKTVASDPETWENLTATLAMAVITEKWIPSLKLPVPKELQPLKNEIQAIINTEKVTSTGVAWEKISGIVRDAAKGKGNFGLGSGTMDEAMAAGKSWVGDGYRIASDGKSLVSKDELRIFRPPTLKPKLGKKQANFEWKTKKGVQPQGNGHLDIIDP